MENKYKYIKEYYNSYDEDSRLSKDKAHKVEFLTTIRYIDKYLKQGNRILEVGAGTGIYSKYYALKGYQIDSLELVESNIDIFRKNITSDMNINLKQGTALNLSCYKDNTFDVTLVLGPLYHLYTLEDSKKAIEEAIRVTKNSGYIYFAYLTNDSIVISYCLKKHHLLEMNRICDSNYKLINNPEEIFSVFYVDEFNKIMTEYDVEYISNIATDGLSSILRDYVNDLSDEEFRIWLDYHYSTCERKDLQGYSNHMLYLCKKK